MLFERPQRWNVVAGQFGYSFSDGMYPEQLGEAHRYIRPFSTGMPEEDYPYNRSREQLIENRFNSSSRTHSTNQSMDALLLGVTYTGRNIGVAFSHYLRGDNSYEIGRGWYDSQPLAVDNLQITDRKFSQQYNLRHEIGLAMASEYDLISGWLSDLSRIYIGVNAKLILPLAYSNTKLSSLYATSEDSQIISHTGSYSSTTAGNLTQTYETRGALLQDPASLFDFSGIGGGFDLGITYILGFGGDISMTTRNRVPTRNSIRLSASINDIGFISYTQNLGRWIQEERTQNFNSDEVSVPLAGREFSGNPADFYQFIDGDVEKVLADSPQNELSAFRVLLPAQLNAGIGIQLNRLIIGAEFQQPLNSLDNREEQTRFHLGGELRLIRTLPLRAGMQFESGERVRYHAGAGLDFRNLVFSVALVGQSTGVNEELLPVVTSVAALQLRF